MELSELTKALSGLSAPAGFEQPAADFIREQLAPYADEFSTDALGNLLCFKRCGRGNARLVMLCAHMDEVGLIVTGEEDGFLRFDALGGIDKRLLAAREVKILGKKPLFGVIDAVAPHLLNAGDADTAVDTDKLCIDAGLTPEQAREYAPAGTPVVFAGPCTELSGGFLCGKALDDRACCAVVMKAFQELADKKLSVDVCCLFSAQEETGCRGAAVGAYGARPDTALVMDVTFAKTPDAPNILCAAGKGAAIAIGPNMNRAVTQRLFDLCREQDIPHQAEPTPGNSGTDAWAVQISREGVATGLVSVPIRYMHTPAETVLVSDMEAAVRLLTAYILREGEEQTDA